MGTKTAKRGKIQEVIKFNSSGKQGTRCSGKHKSLKDGSALRPPSKTPALTRPVNNFPLN